MKKRRERERERAGGRVSQSEEEDTKRRRHLSGLETGRHRLYGDTTLYADLRFLAS